MNLGYNISIDDPVIVYSLEGKITNDMDFEELEKEVFDHLSQNYYRIVFDLEKLTHTNSSGISFFMRTLTKSRIMSGDLVLVNLTGNVKKIFEIAKLDEVYTICKDQLAGINYFKTNQ
ncbi:MAG: STAS domain-containing protein [Crocinitomicaceae bacterium]|nr:STAS domain-containing protein [Crocinitomicaceae bacterium]